MSNPTEDAFSRIINHTLPYDEIVHSVDRALARHIPPDVTAEERALMLAFLSPARSAVIDHLVVDQLNAGS